MDGTSISRIPLTGAHGERGARAPHKRQTPSRRHPLSVLSVLEKDAQIDRTERDQQQAASGGRRPGSPGSACGELNGARSAETVRLDPMWTARCGQYRVLAPSDAGRCRWGQRGQAIAADRTPARSVGQISIEGSTTVGAGVRPHAVLGWGSAAGGQVDLGAGGCFTAMAFRGCRPTPSGPCSSGYFVIWMRSTRTPSTPCCSPSSCTPTSNKRPRAPRTSGSDRPHALATCCWACS